MKKQGELKITEQDRMKYEIADELGLLDKVINEGWKSLSARETGKIGGLVNARKKKENAKKC